MEMEIRVITLGKAFQFDLPPPAASKMCLMQR
jgi:hypothetical protein